MSVPTMTNADSTAATRANAYFALARTLAPPRQWAADLPDTLRDAFGAFPPPLADHGDRLAQLVTRALDERKAVEVEHAKLFLGPFEIRAAPWASFYLEDEPQLMGPTSQYAAQAYAEAGLAPSDRLRDAPDHVTHELEFMYYLAFQEATTGEPVWADRQRRFWREHLSQWLPSFARALKDGATHPVYAAIADAIVAFTAVEAEHL